MLSMLGPCLVVVREEAELLAVPRAEVEHLQPPERRQRVAEARDNGPVKSAGETAATLQIPQCVQS